MMIHSPDHDTLVDHGALNVLRECMYGEVLLDITGSDHRSDGARSLP